MSLSRVIASISLLDLLLLGTGAVYAQSYPSKPIRIVTGSVGGNSDFSSRFIAQGISPALGYPVIVENRGGGILPGLTVAKAPPDGYTLLVAAGSLWNGPLLRETPYDPVKDFAPVSIMNRSPLLFVVHPTLPVKSVREFVALAKARPGQLNSSSSSVGSASHLSGELFKQMTGINVVHINYKSGGMEMNDLVGGYIQYTIGTMGEVGPHVQSKKLRALAVTSPVPSPLMPGLPTVASAGLPGYESLSMTGMFAPAKTPQAVVNRVSQEIARFVKAPAAQEKFFSTGVEAVGSAPEELETAMLAEIARWGKLIKEVGIKAD
jgi:tripartite-type tricarboxylate transporter receptor subunit TctC